MPQSSFRFEAIGTFFEISTPTVISETLRQDIINLAEMFDAEFSRFKPNSLVSQISKKPGIYILPKSSIKLFELYEDLYKITAGKVTPLIGESLSALGYDATYSLKPSASQPAKSYEEFIQRHGTELTVNEPVMMDVGAAGKGFLVDRIAEVLRRNGHAEFVIDASGDILHKGNKPEVIGLEDPINRGKVIGEIHLNNQALCASAINRRAWGDGLHHIVDPHTGKPTEAIIATWVIAQTTMLADGLATALFFTEPDLLKEQYTYEYMRIHANGKIDFSIAFKDSLY